MDIGTRKKTEGQKMAWIELFDAFQRYQESGDGDVLLQMMSYIYTHGGIERSSAYKETMQFLHKTIAERQYWIWNAEDADEQQWPKADAVKKLHQFLGASMLFSRVEADEPLITE